MAKLPKKSTMKETIRRVDSYAVKLLQAKKIDPKLFNEILNSHIKLEKAIDK